MVRKVAWWAFCAMVVVAVWQGASHDPHQILDEARAKAGQWQEISHKVVAALGLTEDGTPPKLQGKVPHKATPAPSASSSPSSPASGSSASK